MKRKILFPILWILFSGLSAQNIGFAWARGEYFGMGATHFTSQLYEDGAGHVYTTVQNHLGNFGLSFFKYDMSTGNQLVYKTIYASTASYQLSSISVKADNSGNIYLSGIGQGGLNTDFDPGPGTFVLTSSVTTNFIAKYSNTGNFLFAFATDATVFDLAFDAAGNIYTAGSFTGTADFDWSPAVYNLTSNGSSDIFIAKYTSNGQFIRATNIGSAGTENAYSIKNDGSDKFIVGGVFNSPAVDFDPGVGMFNVNCAGGMDLFIARYDSAYNFNWANGIGGTGNELYAKMSKENNKLQIVTLYNSPSFDVDLSVGTQTLSSAGPNMYGMISYDTSRALQFAYSLNLNISNITINDVYLNSLGHLSICGALKGTADMDPGPGVANLTLTAYTGTYNPPPTDWFLGTYNSAGYKKAYSFGKIAGSTDNAFKVTGNANDEIVVGGTLTGSLFDYDPSPAVGYSNISGSSTFYMAFAAKYNFCMMPPSVPTAVSGSTMVCYNTTNQYSISPVAGALSYTWSASPGWTCTPSANSSTLTVNNTSGTLQVTATNACGTSSPSILGITANSCVGISETEGSAATLFISPNPSHDRLSVVSDIPLKKISVLNSVGQVVHELHVPGSHAELDLSGLSDGLYYLEVTDAEGRSSIHKLIKQ